jgi:hypothetical protein
MSDKLAYERAIADGERLAALSELRGTAKALAVCDAWMDQDEEALQALFKEDHSGWWDLACRDFLVAEYRDLASHV